MSRPIISVENLGKRYRLRHAAQGGYVTFREAIAQKVRSLARRSPRPVDSQTQEDFWALRDVSFEIKQGDVVGIIGRNGAGKSTLLKVLSRITEPTTGRVRLGGRVASLLEVGTGFHPELTGRENIFLNGAILGMSKAEIRSKFDEIVVFAEVEKFLDTPVKHYSSGMYVRLAFAVAAHLEPEILVVDEVLAVGDSQFQEKCLGKMKQVAVGEGRTVLFVSHNLAAVEYLCASAIMLDGGNVVQTGETTNVLKTYRSRGGDGGHDAEIALRRRPSWATPIITAARIRAIDEERHSNFSIGESILIEVSFQAPADKPITAPVLGIVIRNSMEVPVGAVNMRMTGHMQPARMAAGTITCALTEPLLAPGRYTIDAWLGDGLTDIDVVDRAAAFTIESSDYYGSGVPPFDHLGHLILKPSWNVTCTRLPTATAATTKIASS